MSMSLLGLYAVVIGLCIGSFLNVCIHRLPVAKSIIHPGSSCPQCGTAIRIYDNIPVISFILLRGRCRFCSASISPRYPVVELMSGLFALAVFLKFGITMQALIYFIFIAALLVITFIDLDHQIIPDVITLPGIPLGLAASFGLPSVSFWDAMLGLVAGGGSLMLVAWGYTLITKKDGMGGGDVKLLAMIGALTGWQGVLFTILVGSAVGTVCGLIVMQRQKSDMKLAIPFGPFLSIGAIVYIFFGPALISWYFGLMY